jgi:hypothetical protein
MSGGGSALVVAFIVLVFVIIALWGKRERDTIAVERKHHDRLLEELKQQPHTENDEFWD